MKNTLVWLEGVLLIAPFAALVVLWNQIPARVPIHWNIRGEIDGSAPKTIGLLITPIIALLAVALCHVASWLDPKLGRNLEKSDGMNKVLQILPLAFTGFSMQSLPFNSLWHSASRFRGRAPLIHASLCSS
jgi:hypothetical protein